MPNVSDAAALVVGAAAGYGADGAIAHLAPRLRTAGAAAELVTAAAIYPLARRRLTADTAMAREAAGLAATTAVAALSRNLSSKGARRLLAAAWAGHALFDGVHSTTGGSRLPRWYPAACAGYDVALAARLVAVP
jgi:hypothetical protein